MTVRKIKSLTVNILTTLGIAAAAILSPAVAGLGEAYAGPARKVTFIVSQPDGTQFRAKIYGDEFSHRTTTEDGREILQDAEGYWCYAEESGDGGKYAGVRRVGCADRVEDGSETLTKARIVYRSEDRIREKKAAFAEMVRKRRELTRAQLTGNRTAANGVTATKSASQTINVLVLLVEFSDQRLTYGREYFENLLNKSEYNYNGATGSVKDYFKAQMGSDIDFNFTVSPVATLSKSYKDYGANTNGDSGDDKDPEGMVRDACTLLDSQIDYSQFSYFEADAKGNKYVDFLFVFYAGGAESEYAGSDRIWPHSSYIQPALQLDGVYIQSYACTSELMATKWKEAGGNVTATAFKFATIGTFCHEFSHMLGLMDMYDTDYDGSDGQSKALWGSTGLMDSGNQNNDGNTPPYYSAIDRYCLGLSDPIVLTEGTHSLEPVHRNGRYYKMDGGRDGEYYLIECRKAEGWDKYIGGSGLLVYHIDSTSRNTGYSYTYKMNMTARNRWYYNEINCRPDHQCADLIEANPNAERYTSTDRVAEVFFPYGNYNYLNSSNGLITWDNDTTPLTLKNITRSSSGTVTFTAATTGALSVSGYEVFSNSAIINFTCAGKTDAGEVVLKYGISGSSKTETIKLSPYADADYAVRLDGLDPRKGYKVEFVIDGVTAKTLEFTTSSAIGKHRIQFGNVERDSQGYFPKGAKLPLVVNNSSDAMNIEWYFDGQKIEPEGDEHYSVSRSGTLKAVLNMSDGSRELIFKKIVVK